jgi:multidrug efflux pump subunit AcrA (membrane-fusion protein)
MVLYVVARFTGNFVRNFSPEWGFIPEIGVALIIFRSRIRLLVNFMKFLYLDKKDRILAWFTPKHTAMAAGTLALLLAIPFWKESVTGKFVLEPVNQALVRAHVPGRVESIFVGEGDAVAKGAPLADLSNMALRSGLDDAKAKLVLASAQVKGAALSYQGYGNALMEEERSAKHYGQLSEMNGALQLKAPLAGTVVTPKVQQLLGAYLKTGTEFLEIADLSVLRARIYISEYYLYKIKRDETARLQLDGLLKRRDGTVAMVSARPAENPMASVVEAESGSGKAQPHQYYFVDISVENPERDLKPGMTGVARVYGNRRSLGGMAFEEIRNFWGRKLW